MKRTSVLIRGMKLTTIKEETPSILHAAWMIALVTIASKFLGFARDMVVANFYGATMISDAYFYALQIPSLAIIILGGVGGPFHSATVAVFSKLGVNIGVNIELKKNPTEPKLKGCKI